MPVCMYVSMYVCMYACMYVCMFVCVYTSICVYVCVCTSTLSVYSSISVFICLFYLCAGTRPHFIYGHSSADFSRYADIPRESGSGGGGDELYVFMVRNPMSWMVSRHQHHLRYMCATLPCHGDM